MTQGQNSVKYISFYKEEPPYVSEYSTDLCMHVPRMLSAYLNMQMTQHSTFMIVISFHRMEGKKVRDRMIKKKENRKVDR